MIKECNEEESRLEELKEKILELEKENNLPSFENLNKDFNIERVAEIETDYLVREIRKFMADKFQNYLRFIEAILHPVSAPMFVFSMIKSLNPEEKKILAENYKKLAKIEIELIELDLNFNEEKEIKFIQNSYKIWQEIKTDIGQVIENVKKNWDNKIEFNGSEKGYFG